MPSSSDLKPQLCELLEKAAQVLDTLGDRFILSSYDSGPAMAKYLRDLIPKIEAETISGSEKSELRCIFAPSSDWDDVIGDADLGNDVYKLALQLFPFAPFNPS